MPVFLGEDTEAEVTKGLRKVLSLPVVEPGFDPFYLERPEP